MNVCTCHLFEDLEDCTTDAQCAVGQRCNASGKFCEQDTGPVLIGACIPLSGSMAARGTEIQVALRLAEATINAQGGVLGRPVRVVVHDDESSVDAANECVQAHLDARVAGVVGPITSAQVLASQELSFREKVLQITAVAGASSLSKSQPPRDRYLFQTVTSIYRGSASAIALLASGLRSPVKTCHNMAILHQDDVTGRDYRDSLLELFPKLGGCVSNTISFPASLKGDYNNEVEQLIKAAPDCAVIVTSPKIGSEIIGQLAARTSGNEAWKDFYWIGSSAMHLSSLLEEKLPNQSMPIAEGIYGAEIDTAPNTQGFAQYCEAYQAFAGTSSPPTWSGNAHDAVMLIALAVEKAGSLENRRAIRDALWEVADEKPGDTSVRAMEYAEALRLLRRGQGINYVGASGAIEFDDFGVVANDTLIWHVSGGVFLDGEKALVHYTEAETGAVQQATGVCQPE